MVTLSVKRSAIEGVWVWGCQHIKDEDSGENGVAFVIRGHKDGAWHILDEKGKRL